jgi:methylated-DNA-protein-cysteine methyltransferase related protein
LEIEPTQTCAQKGIDCHIHLATCETYNTERIKFAIMPRTEEAQWWYDAVYSTVQLIPPGQCTSYGHIAVLLGHPQRARQVGVCLKHLPSFDPSSPDRHFYHDQNVPWQRVVNAKGGISPRGDGGLGASRQVQQLRREGVVVNDQGNGIAEAWVDLGRWGWFPARIPGEEESESDDEEE